MIGNVTEFIAYAAARGVVILPEEAPVFLTKAADYLAMMCWEGKSSSDDAPWPRTGLVYDGSTLIDADGNVITEILVDGVMVPVKDGDVVPQAATPKSIITATYRLGMEVANGVDLMPTVSGSQTLSERVEGAVAVTYAESSIGTPLVLPWLDNLIGSWTTCEPSNGVNFSVSRG